MVLGDDAHGGRHGAVLSRTGNGGREGIHRADAEVQSRRLDHIWYHRPTPGAEAERSVGGQPGRPRDVDIRPGEASDVGRGHRVDAADPDHLDHDAAYPWGLRNSSTRRVH